MQSGWLEQFMQKEAPAAADADGVSRREFLQTTRT
jgi:hypothetical protein